MNIVYLGIDLAKNVFQLCGLNLAGKPLYTKRVARKILLQTVVNIPACLIGIEASTGVFFWQREFEKKKLSAPSMLNLLYAGKKMTAMMRWRSLSR